ncbi:PP5 [Symbiodinium sp. CCMP2592]|nr:PP5 [Symbiodinium sp. CCMP2592]
MLPVIFPKLHKGTICRYLDLNIEEHNARSDILLLIIGDSSLYQSGGKHASYATAWGCYADAWKMKARAIDPLNVPTCEAKDPDFGRFCAQARILEGMQDLGRQRQTLSELGLSQLPRWIFHVDSGTLPLSRRLDLRRFVYAGRHLVFSEEFHTGRILPGPYISSVSNHSALFFRAWEHRAMDSLQLHLLDWLRNELLYSGQTRATLTNLTDSLLWVAKLYKNTQDTATHDVYTAAAKFVLGPRRQFRHLVILRRGMGFCAEASFPVNLTQAAVLGQRFLCVQAPDVIQQLDPQCLETVFRCEAWLVDCLGTSETNKDLLRSIRSYEPQRMSLGMVNDVQDCWPNCPADVSARTWAEMEIGLSYNARCHPHQSRVGCCCNDFNIIEEHRAAQKADMYLLLIVSSVGVLIGMAFGTRHCYRRWRRGRRRASLSGEVELTHLPQRFKKSSQTV